MQCSQYRPYNRLRTLHISITVYPKQEIKQKFNKFTWIPETTQFGALSWIWSVVLRIYDLFEKEVTLLRGHGGQEEIMEVKKTLEKKFLKSNSSGVSSYSNSSIRTLYSDRHRFKDEKKGCRSSKPMQLVPDDRGHTRHQTKRLFACLVLNLFSMPIRWPQFPLMSQSKREMAAPNTTKLIGSP